MEEQFDTQETHDNNRIIPVNIEEQMKTAYIDYSMLSLLVVPCRMLGMG